MMKALSILIPTYNDDCSALVAELYAQAEKEGLEYEIVVGDDGSTDLAIVSKNERACHEKPHCSYVRRDVNGGRASIRNFLAQQARYEHLLFLDCHVDVPDGFISRYALWEGDEAVVCGGVRATSDADKWKDNLRYRYEHAAEARHQAEARRKHPYKSFRTTNFMIRRETMLAYPFDEQFRNYGYEDVLYGKELAEHNVSIAHMNNEVAISQFESNERYVEKMEEALGTLNTFAPQLRGYSALLSVAERLEACHLAGVAKWLFQLFRKGMRKRLCKGRPALSLFTAYRLGYFLELRS